MLVFISSDLVQISSFLSHCANEFDIPSSCVTILKEYEYLPNVIKGTLLTNCVLLSCAIFKDIARDIQLQKTTPAMLALT